MNAAEPLNASSLPRPSDTHATCKICTSRSEYVFSLESKSDGPEPLGILLCPNCGLLFVGNPISDKELTRLYRSLDQDTYYQQISKTLPVKISRAISDIRTVLPPDPARSSVLDVGCGYGHFLDALSTVHPPLRAVGHELPGQAASAYQKKGFHVFTSDLENISDRFSLISLLDVAEHLPNPNRTFAACYALLHTGGYIYIHTPRRCFWDNLFLALLDAPALGRLARAWFTTRLSLFHLHLWTDKALTLALQKAGFHIVYLRPELELSWPLSMYVKMYLGEKFRLPRPILFMIHAITSILFVWLRTLRNKAICLAQKTETPT